MQRNRLFVSGVFIVLALFVIIHFLLNTEIKVEFETYFKPEYYLKFSAILIAFTLLNAGILLLKGLPKANLMLAIFGYMLVLEILFDLIGITLPNISTIATVVLLIAAIPALWIAHSNLFDTQKLSYKGLVISLLIGVVESLIPIWL